MLKEIDFWHESGDVLEEWLNEDEYVVWLCDAQFDGRDQLMKDLEADPRTAEMEIYVIIKEEGDDYNVKLSILFKDAKNNVLGEEKEYALSSQDNEYMVKCLTENKIIDNMKYEIRERQMDYADNE